jgi:hypothetical protein
MASLFFAASLFLPGLRIWPSYLPMVSPLPILSHPPRPGDSPGSVLVLMHCRMIETRRFEGSSESFRLRNRCSAKPKPMTDDMFRAKVPRADRPNPLEGGRKTQDIPVETGLAPSPEP